MTAMITNTFSLPITTYEAVLTYAARHSITDDQALAQLVTMGLSLTGYSVSRPQP